MSRAYDMWIHQQLEPTDIIITGNRKRHHEMKKEYVIAKDPDTRTPEQIEAAEDEYLQRHGVPVKPKS